MQFDFLMCLDAPHVAAVAHGDVAVVAADHDLIALGDDVALAADARVDGRLCAAVADGFDLLDVVRHLEQPQAAGEELGEEVGPQAEAEHRDVEIVDDPAELVDLRGLEELALVDDDDVGVVPLGEQRVNVGVRQDRLGLGLEPDAVFMCA